MYNKNPKFTKSTLTKRLCLYGIILLAVLSIIITILWFKNIISEELTNSINCLSSLLSSGLLSRLVKHRSKNLLYFLASCTGVCFFCFILVLIITF